jgi:hypothetical protein
MDANLLKAAADLGSAGLMAACLIYMIRYVGNHMSGTTMALQSVCQKLGELTGVVESCPKRKE